MNQTSQTLFQLSYINIDTQHKENDLLNLIISKATPQTLGQSRPSLLLDFSKLSYFCHRKENHPFADC